MEPWENPKIRALIVEWLRQQDRCLKLRHPHAYVDQWGRICGDVGTGTIRWDRPPECPPDWDNHRYLWHHNWKPDYLSHDVRQYVQLRMSGKSEAALSQCEPGRDPVGIPLTSTSGK